MNTWLIRSEYPWYDKDNYQVIGCTPNGEACVSVSPDIYYLDAMREECEIYKRQLQRMFCARKDIFLKVVRQPHDFGSYDEVFAFFDDNSKDEEGMWDRINEMCAVEKWDEQALAEIKASEKLFQYFKDAQKKRIEELEPLIKRIEAAGCIVLKPEDVTVTEGGQDGDL